MKKIFLVFLVLLLTLNAFALDIEKTPGSDVIDEQYIDSDIARDSELSTITPGVTATNAAKAEEIEAVKTSGTPGYSYLFEADTTNTLTYGWQGPDDLTVNISNKYPGTVLSVGNVLKVSAVDTGQTLPNGETGTIITWEESALGTGSGVGGYVTPPTYSDDTCTTGQYSWDGTYYYGCESTDAWDRFAVTWAGWSNPTPTIPTYSSGTISAVGNVLVATFSVAVTQGSGWAETLFTLDGTTTGEGIAVAYDSGNTTDEWTFITASEFVTGETVTLNYEGTVTDAVESSTGGDLAVFTDQAVTNNSTVSPAAIANFYFKLEAAGTGGDAGKVYDEITSSWIGAISGATFVTGCDSNGVMFDANTEYVLLTSAEQTTAGLTDYRTGDIYFYYSPTGVTGSNQFIFHAGDVYGLDDSVSFFWDGDADSRWTFRSSEAYTINSRQWENSDASPSTCAYYRLVWDLSAASPYATLYKGTTPGDLAEQTGSDISSWTQITSVIPIGDMYIGNVDADDAKHANGIIDDFKWEQP